MSRRTDTAQRAHQDLTAALNGLGPAIQRLMDSRPALPGAASYDGHRTGRRSSSTETLALAPDPTRAEIAQLDRVLNRLAADTNWLASFTARHTPKAPSDKQRSEVERANTPPEDCEHHAKLGVYEPMKGKGPTDVAGNLPHPLRLCESCYRHTYRKGRLPPADLLEREHHLGKQVREHA